MQRLWHWHWHWHWNCHVSELIDRRAADSVSDETTTTTTHGKSHSSRTHCHPSDHPPTENGVRARQAGDVANGQSAAVAAAAEETEFSRCVEQMTDDRS
jgi:hypothetical protein